jgi:hypothetical protein
VRRAAGIAGQRSAGHLDEGTRRDRELDPRDVALQDVVPLWMGKHNGDSCIPQAEDLVDQVLGPAAIRELDQDETRVSGQRVAGEIVLVELAQAAERDLGAGHNAHEYLLLGENSIEGLDATQNLLRARRVVGANVRRRRDHGCAVPRSRSSDTDALADVSGTVVDGGKNVRVEVDHASCAGSDRTASTTAIATLSVASSLMWPNSGSVTSRWALSSVRGSGRRASSRYAEKVWIGG